MSVTPKVRIGDFGTRFEVTIVNQHDESIVDISGATTKEIIFKNKNGTRFARSASFTNDGKDGKMYADTQAGDINVTGDWRYMGHVITSSGEWHTEELKFIVEDIL